MTLVAPGLFYRALSVEERIGRVRARFDREIETHNAHCAEILNIERVPPLRQQVLQQFTPKARRLAG